MITDPTDPTEHLRAELQRLDLLLHREILCLRAAYQLSLDEFRGLYVSDAQVDALIDRAYGNTEGPPIVSAMTAKAEELRQANRERFGPETPWNRLAAAFDLSPEEQDLLLIAVAPDLDHKYETLYAYLNNDVTRKWPTVDMALRLLTTPVTPQERLRRCLLPDAPLFRTGLLCSVSASAERPSWRAGGFAAAPPVVHAGLGTPCLDPCLAACVEMCCPAADWDVLPVAGALRDALCRAVSLLTPTAPGMTVPILVFEGRYGSGRRQAAEAVCRERGLALLRVDWEAGSASGEPLPKLIQALALQARLQNAGVLLERGESFFNAEGRPSPEGRRLLQQLALLQMPVLFACEPGTRWQELLRGLHVLPFRFEMPTYDARLRLWEAELAGANVRLPLESREALADRFLLTPGQIREAVAAARDANQLYSEPLQESPGLSALTEAARAQTGQSLGKLAVKVTQPYTWDDLVLPRPTLVRIQEIAAAIRYRQLVYTQWGFARRLAGGTGLKALFAGASGTGKTMTAGVIARDLSLDLYKIDLSGVVSKYIGETEKNLDTIFRAAHNSSAILFFDEADALFGKRSEVKDAHDRYANIEVSYLLQKMEDHEGVVILASNLSSNIDDAFARRMHYVVDFPLPDATLREKLWRGMFPPQAPLGEDVDFGFLAGQFALVGGDIRNVALAAAFLAAQDGKVVRMEQLIRAMARQMIKQGKIPSPADFKQYHALIGQSA
jgi:hypothetical protein